MKRRVLVTGSEGYIGTVLMPMLRTAGFDAFGVDTCWFEDAQLFPHRRTWELVRKDVRDLERAEVGGCWAIVGLAALSNDPVGELNEETTLDINHRANIRLAEIARAEGAERFVFSSSCSMYGVAKEGLVNESAEFRPQTAYARAKVSAERDLRSMAGDRFSPVYLRNATAYGMSPRQRLDLVLPNLAGWAHTAGEIRILSDGTPWRPIVHIRDICRAICCALEAPRESIHNEAFNIGSNAENYRIRQIAEAVGREYPDCRITFGPPPEKPDTRSYRVDFSKVHSTLRGFRTAWSVADGAKECADTFRQIDFSSEQFERRHFTRLKQLQYLMATGQLDHNLRWKNPSRRAA